MSVTRAAGFRAAGVAAGLRSGDAPDVALVVNDGPRTDAAAVFTTNRCKAHPVLWSEQVVRDGRVRAVVLNAGGANCYTGPEGFATTHLTAERVAEHLGTGAIDVVVCSTGLIGVPLDRERLLRGVDEAARVASHDGGAAAARAIMTTDTHPKEAVAQREGWCVGGMAKGAGMLAPQLATMLVVLTTDAVVPSDVLDRSLRAATRVTFDRLDSDGCMSTNDTVVVMASGAADVAPGEAELTGALVEVCGDLARQLLADAEGADHEIAICVRGAASEADAVDVGRSVARSNLFKAAVFGKDPNWGRVLASIGTTGARFDPADLDVSVNGVRVCRASAPDQPPQAVDLTGRAVLVEIDLKSGTQEATVWTNDLTHAYVHENSAYST